ncbi:MAG: hypothetical protein IPM29_27490 [Planctomycetes bacterium]|nr:hypothetical protein [Planctomycetota bacterium]
MAAQSASLTTTYRYDGLGYGGNGVFFDLQVHVPVTIDRLEASITNRHRVGTIELWSIPGGHSLANITSTNGWTMQGSATVVSEGIGAPSSVVFTDGSGNPAPFTLMPGLYGIALCYQNHAPAYSTSPPNNRVYSNSDMTLTAGSIQSAYFVTPRAGAAIWNGTIYYTVSPAWATWQSYGTGCPSTWAAFYEGFGGAVDLAGAPGSEGVVRLDPVGSGYLVTIDSPAWHTPTSAPLSLGDDTNSAPQLLPFTLSYPGGSTNRVIVGSNGYVYLGSGVSAQAYYGRRSLFLTDGPRLAAFWGDLNPAAGGSVHFDVDPSGNAAYVTWLAVPEYAVPNAVSTFQICIRSSGIIDYRYRSCVVGFAQAIAGWSPGRGVPEPEPIDISAAAAAGFVTGPDARPITLGCTGRPVLGQGISLDVAGIPTNTALAAVLMGFGRTPAPGLSLDNLFGGTEGCFQHVTAPLLTAGALVGPMSTGSIALTVPLDPSFAGGLLFNQAVAAISPPAYTTSGLITSNGVWLLLQGL